MKFGVFMGSIGERLKVERQRLDLNQTEMGELGGVLKQAQIKYEKGERFPDAAYLAAIAQQGADVQFIVTGIRSESVPALDSAERVLLENYRRCAKNAQVNLVQTSALLAAGLQEPKQSQHIEGAMQIFHQAPTGTVIGRDQIKKGKS